MFEVGHYYRITMDLAGERTTYGRCEVKRVEMPLIEVIGMKEGPDWETGTTIINTHSAAFVSAELVAREKTVPVNIKPIFVRPSDRDQQE
jgi:hypothetical protein